MLNLSSHTRNKGRFLWILFSLTSSISGCQAIQRTKYLRIDQYPSRDSTVFGWDSMSFPSHLASCRIRGNAANKARTHLCGTIALLCCNWCAQLIGIAIEQDEIEQLHFRELDKTVAFSKNLIFCWEFRQINQCRDLFWTLVLRTRFFILLFLICTSALSHRCEIQPVIHKWRTNRGFIWAFISLHCKTGLCCRESTPYTKTWRVLVCQEGLFLKPHLWTENKTQPNCLKGQSNTTYNNLCLLFNEFFEKPKEQTFISFKLSTSFLLFLQLRSFCEAKRKESRLELQTWMLFQSDPPLLSP